MTTAEATLDGIVLEVLVPPEHASMPPTSAANQDFIGASSVAEPYAK